MKRGAGPAGAEALAPGERVPAAIAALGESDELGPATQILPGDGIAQAHPIEGDAAVGAAITIIAHQEDMVGRNRDRAVIVGVTPTQLDRFVVAATRQGLGDEGEAAILLAIFAGRQCPWIFLLVAGRLRVDRNQRVM